MYKYSLLLLALAFSSTSSAEEASNAPTAIAQAPLLPWTTDYEQAIVTAKTESLPIYLFFTGSTWCIWCKKMEKELHEQDSFRQKLVGKFLFVKVDLPAGAQPSENVKNLMKKYNIRGVPTVLILSPEGQELARFRYQKIEPEAYADLVVNSLTSV